MFTVGIITASDKGAQGQRIDESGKVIQSIVRERGYTVVRYVVLPDDYEELSKEMIHMADDLKINLVLTTGGTGFSERDITPEATKSVIEREAPGVAEAIRAYSLSITLRAMLSRGLCGIRKKTVILNLPGSPKAVKESLEYVIDSMHHGLEILLGRTAECARQ
jgi:molybdenum cofactor synthesis domain-containing protein